jgi:SagB-type dehydrogenase family enzyme
VNPAGAMSDPCSALLVVRLHPDVREVAMAGQALRIAMRSWKEPEDVPFPYAVGGDVLAWLAAPGLPLCELRARAQRVAGGWEAVSEALASLGRKRLLAWAYGEPADPLLLIEALGGRFAPDYEAAEPTGRPLSRFAYLHREDQRLLLESPEVDARVVVTARGRKLLPALMAAGGGPAAERDPALEHLLARLGFLEASGPEPESRRTWAFHDRLFHEATRANASGRVLGGTYRFETQFASPPAVKPPMSDQILPLPAFKRGNSGSLLYDVMERRRSLRGPGRRALRLEELAELLWRVARVREVLRLKQQDLLSRTIPGGGSIGELEFYPVITRCEGLAPGFYHYVGTEHALAAIPAAPALVSRLLDQASMAQALENGVHPDCVLVVSARYPRLGWKYENMAYRASLMNAGVAYEALYLVATDLGLSPCATGTGSSALFEQITGLSPWEETAIAEFTVSGPQ